MKDCLLSHSDETKCVRQAGESAKPGRSGEFPTTGGRDLEIESVPPSADNSPQKRSRKKGVQRVAVFPTCNVGTITWPPTFPSEM